MEVAAIGGEMKRGRNEEKKGGLASARIHMHQQDHAYRNDVAVMWQEQDCFE